MVGNETIEIEEIFVHGHWANQNENVNAVHLNFLLPNENSSKFNRSIEILFYSLLNCILSMSKLQKFHFGGEGIVSYRIVSHCIVSYLIYCIHCTAMILYYSRRKEM